MNIFGDGLGDQGAADADEEWPPFRKVRLVIRLAQFVSGSLYCCNKEGFVVYSLWLLFAVPGNLGKEFYFFQSEFERNV